MADFNKAAAIILKNEGGYVNDPNDPGGATNHGISLRFLKTIGIDGDLDGDGDIDVDDIKLLTPTSSGEIYRKYFWNVNRYNLINDQEVATKLFDFSVNASSVRGHKIMQKALNNLHDNGQGVLVVDGILGKKTMAAINDANPAFLIPNYIKFLKAYYRGLFESNPEKWGRYLRGWLRRAERRYKF